MSELLVGFLLFAMLAFAVLCFVLVMFHIKTQRELQSYLQEIVENQADGFSKLLQTALLHLKAPTPEVAVQLQTVLEREQAMLEQTVQAIEQQIKEDGDPKPPAKRVIGYKGPNGAIYKFMTPPAPHVLAGIDKSRLVYAE